MNSKLNFIFILNYWFLVILEIRFKKKTVLFIYSNKYNLCSAVNFLNLFKLILKALKKMKLPYPLAAMCCT